MIPLSKLKPFRPAQGLIIPPAGIDGKNVSISVICENTTFMESYRFFNIKPNYVRYVFVPTTSVPRTYLTGPYRREIMSHNLRPIRGMFGDYSDLLGKNFYIDLSTVIDLMTTKFHLSLFSSGRAYYRINSIIDTMASIPSDSFEKILLYVVCIDNPLSKRINKRKFFSIYRRMLEAQMGKSDIPFDKLLLFVHDHSMGRFFLLYDKIYPINLPRIKMVALNIQSTIIGQTEEDESDDLSNEVIDDHEDLQSIPEQKKDKLRSAVKTFLDSDPESKNIESGSISKLINKDQILTTSLAYHMTGNIDKAKSIAKRSLTKGPDDLKNVRNNLVKNFSDSLMIKKKPESQSKNDIVIHSNPVGLVDSKSPEHILEKRKLDFTVNLVDDLINVFKPLETADMPVKVRKFNFDVIKTGSEELQTSITDRYHIELIDDQKNIHKITIELPHLTQNGAFLINGQSRVVVNQIIPYPIFYPAPYIGRLDTNYATLSINSKQLRKNNYLMIYLSGYKLPLMTLLGYKLGFEETMKLFKIGYTISETKVENSIKINNNQFISFSPTTLGGEELIESFNKSSDEFPENGDLFTQKFWNDTLIKTTGTRNCMYQIDEVWKYIVTPIEKKILESRGDPIELPEIIKLISEKVVTGYVDDRNSVEKQRIRTAELFTQIIQKQVLSAYNEYKNKRLSGDENARIEIIPKKALSEVVNSQNVQLLESINPMEELSMMTRVTPVGIGGITRSDEFPKSARNIHPSYYGNIDPLETPDSDMVGIQQHLAIGSSITTDRGLFNVKDPNMVKPSEILSVGPAMIPFVESNDGCRVTMGTGQTRQSIPLLNKENPAVQSGYESILSGLLSDNFIKKSPIDGSVEFIDNKLISIRDESGKNSLVSLEPRLLKSGQGKNGISRFKPTVSVGDKVKEGQLIAEGANVKDGLISNGLNLLIAYMPWNSYNFEDGIVISESAAEKFISTHIEEEEVYLTPDDDVAFICNVGDQLNIGGVLMSYSPIIYDVETLKHLRTGGGEVLNIEIYPNIPEENIPEKLLPSYEQFKNYFTRIHGNFPIGSFKVKGDKFDGILVKFTLEQKLVLIKGDKLSNRHGGKGIVSLIEKDENMPKTPWGEPIELIFNPLGVINRMNTGQMLEMHVGLISRKLSEIMKLSNRSKFISILKRVLDLLDGTADKSYSKNLIKYLSSISDKKYQTVSQQIIDQRVFPIIIPPFKSPPRKNILDALSILGLKSSYSLLIPQLNIKTDPVAVGVGYFHKLEHQSEKKLHARGVGSYVGKTLAPTAGKKRGGGQTLGEYDMYSLMGWDTPHIIEEFFGALSSDHTLKNQMISEVIQSGKTNFRQSKTNPVRDMLGQYMLSIHLQSK